jgi:hypothetical protein
MLSVKLFEIFSYKKLGFFYRLFFNITKYLLTYKCFYPFYFIF